jgi:hypothetical protein
MEILKPIELKRIDEIHILHNVRLINKRDLNPIYSKDNLRVQFEITGDIRGKITCYLCLDDKEISTPERNYLFPLFVESMNILVGKQVSLNDDFNKFKIHMSAPKLSMLPNELNTSLRSMTQKYDLEIEELSYQILTEYSLEAIN